MKFPITRETLQAFDYAREQQEIQEEENQKRITLILDSLCTEFKRGMQNNSREKRFVWKQLQNIRQISTSKVDTYLSQFIDRLKELFIGCDITVDPLKTYLIIDWS